MGGPTGLGGGAPQTAKYYYPINLKGRCQGERIGAKETYSLTMPLPRKGTRKGTFVRNVLNDCPSCIRDGKIR